MTEGNKTNLIINYLPQTMSDEQFETLFNSIGPTVSCRIIRDRNTGYSYGFGFVEYQEAKHAALAISSLNGYKVQHKMLKVSYSRPGGDKIKNTNLYVGNLPKDVDEQKLESVFKTYGTVIQSRILKDNSGISRGIGFVRYNVQEEAQLAIDSLNNKPLPGTDTIISIRISTSENEKKQRDMIQKYSKLKSVTSSINKNPYPTSLLDLDPITFLPKSTLMGNGGNHNGLMGMAPYYEQPIRQRHPMINPYDLNGVDQFTYGVTSYNDISSKFDTSNTYNKGQFFYEGYGPPTYDPTPERMKMRMPYPPRGMSMGYMPPIANYPNMGNRMSRPLLPLNGSNNDMSLRPTNPIQSYPPKLMSEGGGNPNKNGDESKLFVYNIGSDTTDKEITNLFWPYGTVLKIDIPKDPKNPILNKGYAFVLMSNVQEAMLAIQYLNNFAFKDKTLQVSLKKENAK